jgi:hypothetical protein
MWQHCIIFLNASSTQLIVVIAQTLSRIRCNSPYLQCSCHSLQYIVTCSVTVGGSDKMYTFWIIVKGRRSRFIFIFWELCFLRKLRKMIVVLVNRPIERMSPSVRPYGAAQVMHKWTKSLNTIIRSQIRSEVDRWSHRPTYQYDRNRRESSTERFVVEIKLVGCTAAAKTNSTASFIRTREMDGWRPEKDFPSTRFHERAIDIISLMRRCISISRLLHKVIEGVLFISFLNVGTDAYY